MNSLGKSGLLRRNDFLHIKREQKPCVIMMIPELWWARGYPHPIHTGTSLLLSWIERDDIVKNNCGMQSHVL